MALRQFVDLRFRDDDGSLDLDGSPPIEVTLRDGLPVNIVQGAGVASEDFLPGQIALAGLVTPKRLVDRRSARTRITIVNMDAAITITVGTSSVTSGNGFPLTFGQSISLFTKADIWAISASGTPTVAWIEEYN